MEDIREQNREVNLVANARLGVPPYPSTKPTQLARWLYMHVYSLRSEAHRDVTLRFTSQMSSADLWLKILSHIYCSHIYCTEPYLLHIYCYCILSLIYCKTLWDIFCANSLSFQCHHPSTVTKHSIHQELSSNVMSHILCKRTHFPVGKCDYYM